ncbi:prephenate dehydratase [Brevibacterium sp. 91QC2O2]|uniref:prephenate dehydratase n=1 Tax=Brevibacterium sp. 91QC2O2 TaxID=2968458 RepID=UPI00211CA248|nr:prephenate dehydratase [Brevibacterium sp. 91QC2O2]MCQ9368038.1 prephenate dehydratase [Brevibacterium sp. 91QC2O2]
MEAAAHRPRLGYLGPEATFTEAALLQVLAAAGIEDAVRVPMRSQQDALEAVAAGTLDGAVVPIENSLEGGVPATLDSLARFEQLRITAETLVAVQFVIAARPGVALADVTSFSTHPHAEAQTRSWIAAHLPAAQYLPATSTAAAAMDLGADAAGELEYQAAICPALAAQSYGLEVLGENIGDRTDTVTRFVLVRPAGHLPAPTGSDKTTAVVALASDRAGALLEMLEQFSARGVNLSRIESRPTGDGLGLYQFSIDAAGHVAEPRMAEALGGVYRFARNVQFLGSYPAADGAKVTVDARTTAQAFGDAAAWLGRIREVG